MIQRSADSTAAPQVVWSLLARPASWPRWAPHVRGAWGLAGEDGAVRAGARGAARLAGFVPVPAVITAVDDGRSWTWRVGGVVDMAHTVRPRPGGGSRVTVTLTAPAALEVTVLAGYAPLVGLLVRRLARVAADAAP